ncbi:ParA family protein [Nostoc sp. WHI]|uniref:ParA family protein n=1 Tax=Nostoc sp. WHI TaxID=2650611 RepID=UPI0018C50863|nr:ParA family protein [Nostoc sp. WHI]
MSNKKHKKVVLAILSNAGGSGKTTLATHLAYELARCKVGHHPCSVGLLDLDPQGSLSLFCGLEKPSTAEKSISSVLSDDFSGDWPLVPCWTEFGLKVEVGQSLQQPLLKTADDLVNHPRGPYLLADNLQDYPLTHDVIIIDCPATLGRLNLAALAASTHILIPIQLEPKSASGAAELLQFYFIECRRLRLEPYPQIMGIVPNQYRSDQAIHNEILEQLPTIIRQLQLPDAYCYPTIRFSYEFSNASGAGLPLHLYRKKHPACKDFAKLASDLTALVGAK